MFDEQGNLIPDEVIAFNFENYYDDNEENPTKSKSSPFQTYQIIRLHLRFWILYLNREAKLKRLKFYAI